jgi:hypothetical protein
MFRHRPIEKKSENLHRVSSNYYTVVSSFSNMKKFKINKTFNIYINIIHKDLVK